MSEPLPQSQAPKAGFDPARFKEQERAGFNLVADRYENAMAVMAPAISRMIELAELAPGLRVLDVATGPGMVALVAAQAVGAEGAVLGVDIAEAALERARQRASAAGLAQATFEVEDAENLNLPDGSFDRVLCSMGLMHFPAPEKALSEMSRVLKPGGRVVVAVWGEAQEAPFINVAITTLGRTFPPPKVERPSMFRFGQASVLQNLIAEAGFADVQTERVVFELNIANGVSYWERFLNAAGITAVALAKQPPETMHMLEREVETDLAPYLSATGYRLDSAIRLATGLKN